MSELSNQESSEKPLVNYFSVPGLVDFPLTRLLYLVAEETGIEASVMRSKDQSRKVADARHLFSVIAREYYGNSFQFLADFLNRTSHSTIKRSVTQGLNYLETDKYFRQLYQQVKLRLDEMKKRGDTTSGDEHWMNHPMNQVEHEAAAREIGIHLC